MRRLPLPAWVFLLSLLLFVATWLAAPAETLSGGLRLAPEAPPRRGGPAAIAAEPTPTPAAVKSDKRPFLIRGFGGRPYELALTFDDGPHPVHTSRLLDILHRHRVKGAFFINGMWLAAANKGRSRAVLRQAHLEGHMVGNHTYSHENLAAIKPKRQTWQIVSTELLLDELLGERPRIFRPPYGQMTRHASNVLKQYGYQQVLWNVSTKEGDVAPDPDRLARQLMMWVERYRGGILLLHDRHRASVDATELLLARLHRKNCRRLRRQEPLFRVVGLDSFLLSPAESQALEPRRAADRARYRRHVAERCEKPKPAK